MNFEKKEANDRLESIVEMIYEHMDSADMLVSTNRLLMQVSCVALGVEPQEEQRPLKRAHIVVSCDASVKKNPGGPAAVGIVVEFPDQRPELAMSRASRATTNNQAEYEAIYFALVTLFNLHNNPGSMVEIRSDSRLAIEQLNKEMECRDESLKNKRDIILEFVERLPVEVRFVWRPRNSTIALKRANHLAQDELGVPRH